MAIRTSYGDFPAGRRAGRGARHRSRPFARAETCRGPGVPGASFGDAPPACPDRPHARTAGLPDHDAFPLPWRGRRPRHPAAVPLQHGRAFRLRTIKHGAAVGSALRRTRETDRRRFVGRGQRGSHRLHDAVPHRRGTLRCAAVVDRAPLCAASGGERHRASRADLHVPRHQRHAAVSRLRGILCPGLYGGRALPLQRHALRERKRQSPPAGTGTAAGDRLPFLGRRIHPRPALPPRPQCEDRRWGTGSTDFIPPADGVMYNRRFSRGYRLYNRDQRSMDTRRDIGLPQYAFLRGPCARRCEQRAPRRPP
jgi:hypothetical protein